MAEESPDVRLQEIVYRWLIRFVETGPPDNGMPVPGSEDLYLSQVGDEEIAIEYLAIAYERRALIRRIVPLKG